MAFTFGDDSGQTDPAAEGQVTDPANQPTGETQQEPGLSPFAQNYLATVPEDQRELVKQHVTKWDAGFNRHSQALHQRYKPYADLGDVEELKQARQVMQQLRDDPASVARFLVEQGYYTPEAPAG